MKPWPATSWTDSGQIVDYIGDVVELPDFADKLHFTPDRFFAALLADQKLREAMYFLGHALPRYEGIVWAAQTLLRAEAIDRNKQLVNAMLRWIDGPSDNLRRDIRMMADGEKTFNAERMLGMAIFMSGGSLSEPDLPPVLAPPNASAKLAAGAVLIAAYATDKPQALMLQAAEIGAAMASQGDAS